MRGKGKYASNKQPVNLVHSNLDQNIINISEDRLRLYLKEYLKRIEQGKDWLGYFGVILTILITFQTSDFKEFLHLSSDTWQALYLGTFVICCVFLFKCIYQRVTSLTIDELLEKVKNPRTRHETLFKRISIRIKKAFNFWVSRRI